MDARVRLLLPDLGWVQLPDTDDEIDVEAWSLRAATDALEPDSDAVTDLAAELARHAHRSRRGDSLLGALYLCEEAVVAALDVHEVGPFDPQAMASKLRQPDPDLAETASVESRALPAGPAVRVQFIARAPAGAAGAAGRDGSDGSDGLPLLTESVTWFVVTEEAASGLRLRLVWWSLGLGAELAQVADACASGLSIVPVG